jgi:hypothetical protein
MGRKIPIHNKSGPEKPDWAVTWPVRQISTASTKNKGQQKGNTSINDKEVQDTSTSKYNLNLQEYN